MTSLRRGRRGRSPVGEDETVGLAGWMYTDLLLGLAVVFLGSIAFAISATGEPEVGEAAAPTTSTTSTTSTTTTTTLPPEECTRLYAVPQTDEGRFRVSVLARTGDEQLAEQFRQEVEAQIEIQNERIEREGIAFPRFSFDDLEVSIVIASGEGLDTNSGVQLARSTMERLQDLFPEQLGVSAVRAQWNSRNGSSVEIELFPSVTDLCQNFDL